MRPAFMIAMNEREAVLSWLAAATSRLRTAHRLNTIGLLVCVVCGVAFVQQLVAVLIPSGPVRSALLPLLVLLGLTGCAIVAGRLRRRPQLTDAALHADTRGQWRDELRSAHWFAAAQGQGPGIDLLMQRAAHRVRGLRVEHYFPLRIPTTLWLAAALAIATSLLALWSPRILWSKADLEVAARIEPSTPMQDPAPRLARANMASQRSAKSTPQALPAERVWAQLKALAELLPRHADVETLKVALAAHDSAAARAATEKLRREVVRDRGTAPAPARDQVSAEVAEGILDRLSQLLNEDNAQPPADATADTESTGRITQQLREQMRQPQTRSADDKPPEENAFDAALRAISRQNYGRRETARGQGEAGEEGGPANATGGAMGRRVGISRAGAGEQDARPDANPTGSAEADPILGARTTRLASALKKVEVPGEPPEDDGSIEASSFAATRSQAAQASYEAVSASSKRAAEATIADERVPAAYREAARRYTLAQHLRDAAARAQSQRAEERQDR
ncbi:MAG TPA: hypothetical protein VFB54_16740 [Burkholderiales bacterium]|nr:hypothetical protein [Burkholderiales bacterium]